MVNSYFLLSLVVEMLFLCDLYALRGSQEGVVVLQERLLSPFKTSR